MYCATDAESSSLCGRTMILPRVGVCHVICLDDVLYQQVSAVCSAVHNLR